jgi:REP element-mobilizing transposase RayT
MAHTFTKLAYHCIFSTKGRARLITPDIRERLYAYIGGILREHGSTSLRAGGTEDHVHLLIELAATLPVADAMRIIKANSSKWIRETFPTHGVFAWQTGYAAFTVSASAIDDVKRYIDRQLEHHRERTFEEEFIEFLRRHDLEYDERYVLD